MYDQYTDSDEEEDQTTSKSISVKSSKTNSIKRQSNQNISEAFLENSEIKKDEETFKSIKDETSNKFQKVDDQPINKKIDDAISIISKTRTRNIEKSSNQGSLQRIESIKTTPTKQLKNKEQQQIEQEEKQQQQQNIDIYNLPNECNIEKCDHYSFTCHLFPRLSESNLQFHDIYWDKNEKEEIILRKRNVYINKLIILPFIRLQQNNDTTTLFKAKFSLFDRRQFAKRQIVSNILSIEIPIKPSGFNVKNVFHKVNSPSILIRSNYSQCDVALQINLEKYSSSLNNIINIGTIEIELLNKKGEEIIGNRSYSHVFDNGKIRFEFKTANVPNEEKIKTDSLPDVLICDERWIGMLAIYRQLLCEKIAQNGDVLDDRPSIIVDPIIANFTIILDNDEVLTELILKLLNKYGAFNKEISSKEAVFRFRNVCNKFMLPALAVVNSENWRNQIIKYLNGEINQEPDPIKLLINEPCKMMKISDYQIFLFGKHSID